MVTKDQNKEHRVIGWPPEVFAFCLPLCSAQAVGIRAQQQVPVFHAELASFLQIPLEALRTIHAVM
jgi:hypothetical protein